MSTLYRNSTQFRVFNVIFMILVIVMTLYPFLFVVSRSFSSERAVISGDVVLLPEEANLRAYRKVVEHPQFWSGYRNTVIIVATSVAVHLFLTIICAYPLSKNHLKGRGVILGFILFTMLFEGGLIPLYLLVINLGLVNTYWAVILPPAISVWNMIIMRTFFKGIPESLEEAAQIDGVSPIGVLFRIVLPLSTAIIATISLFVAVQQWNNWFFPMVFLNDNSRYPVTLFLRNLVIGSQMAASRGEELTAQETLEPAETLKAAAIVLVSVPILMIYPFLQKHFMKGVLIGSVKG